jgi:hypothetical protein
MQLLFPPPTLRTWFIAASLPQQYQNNNSPLLTAERCLLYPTHVAPCYTDRAFQWTWSSPDKLNWTCAEGWRDSRGHSWRRWWHRSEPKCLPAVHSIVFHLQPAKYNKDLFSVICKAQTGIKYHGSCNALHSWFMYIHYVPWIQSYSKMTTGFELQQNILRTVQLQVAHNNSAALVRERTIPTNRQTNHHLSAKLVPTFVDRWVSCGSVTDPYSCILCFLQWSRYFSFQVAPQLNSWCWMNPIPDTTSQKVW